MSVMMNTAIIKTKILLLLTLIFLPTGVFAKDVCPKHEYAMVKDMSKSDLIEEFKSSYINGRKALDLGKEFVVGPEAEYYMIQSSKCIDRADFYAKMLKKRFKFTDKKLDSILSNIKFDDSNK